MSVWNQLKQKQNFYTENSSINVNGWDEKHNWLREQMKIRIPGYNSHYPWCGWLYGYGRKKNYLSREQCHHDQLVKLDLTLNKHSILIFPFNTWIMVKNNGYIGLSPSDYQHWAEKLKEAGLDDSTWPLPAPFYSIVTKSWERIFDLEQLEDGGEWGVWHLQIAFEELSIKNITKVTVY